jgi:acetyltransferase
MASDLRGFFEPRNVAVIGASLHIEKAGGRRWRGVVEGGFNGGLFPVHPTAGSMLGRKVYRSVEEIPAAIDLAVIVVPGPGVPTVVSDCARMGVRAVAVVSGGFGETGPAGKATERELVATLRNMGGRLLGPNCAGLFSASSQLNVLGWSVPTGEVGFVTQSGGIAITFAQLARRRGLGFSRLIATGNAADLALSELVGYLIEDVETKVIVIYVEGLSEGEGRRLYETLQTSRAKKPVVLLKPGRTAMGVRAVLSHTGNLAGQDRVFDAAMEQAGAIRVAEAEEAWDAISALCRLPVMSHPAIAVIADGGGTATVIADAAAQAGLGLPELSPHVQAQLRTFLPQHSAVGNPVDPVITEEQPEILSRIAALCFEEPMLGGVIIGGHFGGYFKLASEELGRREQRVAHELVAIAGKGRQAFVVHSAHADDALPALDVLRKGGVPVYASMEGAAKAMGALWRYSKARRFVPKFPDRRSQPNRSTVKELLLNARESVLLDPDARSLLREYGIQVPVAHLCTTREQTAAAAQALAAPAALKLVSAGLVHKSDIGGVLLNVEGGASAATAYDLLMRRARDAHLGNAVSVLVTPMLEPGVEVIAGAFNDPHFGAVVMFGLGGVFVDVLDDVEFRLAPVASTLVSAMIQNTRVSRLLAGARGRPACDIERVTDILVRIGEIASDWPQLELELNPVFVREHDADIADVRVLLSKGAQLT